MAFPDVGIDAFPLAVAVVFDADFVDGDVVLFEVILDEEHVLAPVVAAAEHVFPAVGGAAGEFVEVGNEVGKVTKVVDAREDHDGEDDVSAALRAEEVEESDAAEHDEEGEAGEDIAEVNTELVLRADEDEKGQSGSDEDDEIWDGGFAVVEASGDLEEPAEQAVGEVGQAGKHDELGSATGLRPGKKGGRHVGNTKIGRGSKVMLLTDGHGTPVAIHVDSTSPHEVKRDSRRYDGGSGATPHEADLR